MANGATSDKGRGFSSSPCFSHELEQSSDGSFQVVDPQQHRDVMVWRKGERKRLIDERMSVPASRRKDMANGIAQNLLPLLGAVDGKTISFYWPLRGEPDLRPLMDVIVSSGGRCALPVVVEKNAPLAFHAWTPGEPLKKGFWNIPVPVEAQDVRPEIILSPVVGFDPGCFRLGYGGGYFDRTLAAISYEPQVMGVGYASAAIATIFPQPHDIPLHCVVSEASVLEPGTQ